MTAKGDLYFDDIEISQTIKTGETVTEQIGVFNTADETMPKSGDVARTEYVFTGLDVRSGDSFVYTVKAWSWSLGEDGVWGSLRYIPMFPSDDGQYGEFRYFCC